DGLPVLDPPAELRRDDDALPPAPERTAEELLVLERTVDFRGIEERRAELERALDRRQRLRLVGRAVRLTHPHAAEAERRDLETLATELSFRKHHSSLFQSSESVVNPPVEEEFQMNAHQTVTAFANAAPTSD